MTALTLTLGSLTFVGTQDGPFIKCSVDALSTGSARASQSITMTIAEWSSLQATVDVLAAADREMARLRGEVERLRDAVPCSACGASDWQIHHCINCVLRRRGEPVFEDGRTLAEVQVATAHERYFVDHDTIHDRETGKHVFADEAARLLNESQKVSQ